MANGSKAKRIIAFAVAFVILVYFSWSSWTEDAPTSEVQTASPVGMDYMSPEEKELYMPRPTVAKCAKPKRNLKDPKAPQTPPKPMQHRRTRQTASPDEVQPFAGWNKAYYAARNALLDRLQIAATEGSAERPVSVHVVAGGDCTYYTQWQAAGLEHSFATYNFRNGGNGAASNKVITFMSRVVSGCEKESDQEKVRTVQKTVLTPQQGAVFMAPAFSFVSESFDPYNHPAMLRYWARRVLMAQPAAGDVVEDFVILADLDAVFTKGFHQMLPLQHGQVAPAEFLEDFTPLRKQLTQRNESTTVPYCAGCPTDAQWTALHRRAVNADRSGLPSAALSMCHTEDSAASKEAEEHYLQTMSDLALNQKDDGSAEVLPKFKSQQPKFILEWGLSRLHYCSFAGPYVLKTDTVLDVLVEWDKLTHEVRGRRDTKVNTKLHGMPFWGIEWYTMAMTYAKLGITPIIDTTLAVSHEYQSGIFTGAGGLSFSVDPQQQPLMIHYGHRGVGWFEYGGERMLNDPRQLRDFEQKHNGADHGLFHFSKFRLPSDWPGGAKPNPRLLACQAPILQQLRVVTPWMQDTLLSFSKSEKLAKLSTNEKESSKDQAAGERNLQRAAAWFNQQRDIISAVEQDIPELPQASIKPITSRSEVRVATIMQILTHHLNLGFAAWKHQHCPSSNSNTTDGHNAGETCPALNDPEVNLEERIRSLHPTYFVSKDDSGMTKYFLNKKCPASRE